MPFEQDRQTESASRARLVDRILSSSLCRLWNCFQGYHKQLVVLLACFALSSIMALVPPVLTKVAVDSLFPKSGQAPVGAAMLWSLSVLAAVAAMSELGVRVFCRDLLLRVALIAQFRLRRRLFAAALRLSPGRVREMKTGGIVALISEESVNLIELTISVYFFGWRAALRLAFSIAALIYIDWRMLLAASCLFPLFLWNHLSWARNVSPLHRELAEKRRSLSAFVTETFGGLRTVHTYNRSRRETARYLQGQREIIGVVRRLSRSQMLESIWELVAIPASAIVIIFGGSRVLNGSLSLGDLVMFLGFVAMLIRPLEQLANTINSFRRNIVGLEQAQNYLRGVIHRPTVCPDAANVSRAPVNTIELKDVAFSYPGSAIPALRNINLTLTAGKVTAIVGASGAGKSTLCDLLLRLLQPSQGEILLDGTNVNRFAAESYRSLFGTVEQEPTIFSGTISENIAYGNPAASRFEIVRAAEASRAREFIDRLPDGFDTLVDEKGGSLSGGQRQRLVIARALLKNPQVLILDEATNHLDASSEQALAASLSLLSQGRICVLISHNWPLVQAADQVIVLEQGELKDIGTPQELLRKRGSFLGMLDDRTATILTPKLQAA